MVNEKKNSANQPDWGATAASILNGCFGDYLNDRDNGLAIDMAFYQNNRPLELSADALRAACPMPLCSARSGAPTTGPRSLPMLSKWSSAP